LVQSTKGVKDVNSNELKITRSQQPFTDTAITAKIKGLYLREKLFGAADVAVMSINVETKNGVVHLTGEADNSTQIQNAVALAKTVDGVKSVESRVKVVAPKTTSPSTPVSQS